MRKLKYPIGISDFAEMRNNGYYYIDKTNVIVDLLDKGPVEVTQITRPRRFGKSLGINSLFVVVDIIFVLQLAHLGTDGISAALVQLVIMCFLL